MRQRGTLVAIFEQPTRSDINWTAAKSMLEAAGARVTNKKGSRRLVVIGDVRGVFHEPHPHSEMRKYCGGKHEAIAAGGRNHAVAGRG